MPSLKEIRARIGSVRNISQITRAMELVAAAQMKRAQEAILSARPYSDELRSALSRVAAAGASALAHRHDHQPRPGRRPGLEHGPHRAAPHRGALGRG